MQKARAENIILHQGFCFDSNVNNNAEPNEREQLKY